MAMPLCLQQQTQMAVLDVVAHAWLHHLQQKLLELLQQLQTAQGIQLLLLLCLNCASHPQWAVAVAWTPGKVHLSCPLKEHPACSVDCCLCASYTYSAAAAQSCVHWLQN